MTVDVSMVDSASPPAPDPKSRVRSIWGEHGETVTVRDFNQRVVCALQITAKGLFHAPEGMVKPEDLGEYILKVTGHPSAR